MSQTGASAGGWGQDSTQTAEIAEARRVDYVGFCYRHPYVTEAYRLGFLPGIREDYELQIEDYDNVDVPVLMLDNDYKNPDLDRYRKRFRELEPEVGVIGDAYDEDEARTYIEAVRELEGNHPNATLIIVPKSQSALEAIPDDITAGYAMGYSDINAPEFSCPQDWRGRDVHLLGASPTKQHPKIVELTRPTITGQPPANIVGIDWNGVHLGAMHGQSWSPDGWTDEPDTLRTRAIKSLKRIRQFWKSKGVWPETTPVEKYGEPTTEPDMRVFADTGEEIVSREDLEEAVIGEYDGHTRAFSSKSGKQFVEYREGWI